MVQCFSHIAFALLFFLLVLQRRTCNELEHRSDSGIVDHHLSVGSIINLRNESSSHAMSHWHRLDAITRRTSVPSNRKRIDKNDAEWSSDPYNPRLRLQPYKYSGRKPKKYFLSAMLMELNEESNIIEFMQHYMEEGVDHVFVYDDGSTDNTLSLLKKCVPNSFYTVFDHTDVRPLKFFQNQEGVGKTQNEGFLEMYNLLGVRDKSEWVIVLDADEFIASRTFPRWTIRDMLMRKLGNCDIVSVPWLVFTWGKNNNTLPNYSRYSLFYRWGFDDKFAVGEDEGKFRNINKDVYVKAIVKTEAVSTVFRNHWADFRTEFKDEHSFQTGIVCIPHALQHMRCAAERKHEVDLEEFAKFPYRFTWEGYQRYKGQEPIDMPAWCPHRNQMLAHNSPHSIKMTEEDVPYLDLAIFHYRVKSLDDWQRMLDPSRFTGSLYTAYADRINEVNRMDVYDGFMKIRRLPARQNHSADFDRVQREFAGCVNPPPDYRVPVSAAIENT